MVGVGAEMFYVEGHLFTGHRNDRMLSVENSGNNLLVVVVLFYYYYISNCTVFQLVLVNWGGVGSYSKQ